MRYLPFVAVLLAVAACSSSAPRPESTSPPDTPTLAPSPGAACASSTTAEFVRQQSLVPWRVYCPALLPVGFRLAGPDDPPDPSALGGDAAPTTDDLNPGGGTFITRLVGPNNAALVFVQGAGASVFVHRDNSGNLIGAPESAPRAQFDGLLEGRVLEAPTPSIVAFDLDNYGHMIIGTNTSVSDVTYVAQAMHVVDNSPQRVMLFSLADLHQVDNQWVVAYPPDASGEDAADPNICDKTADSPPRIKDLMVRFEPAGATNAPAAPPTRILQQSVASFASADDAERYLAAAATTLAECPMSYRRDNADDYRVADVTIVPITLDAIGDQSVAFRRSARTLGQTTNTYIALIRRAETVATILRSEILPGSTPSPSPDAAVSYARLADSKLQRAISTTTSPTPPSVIGTIADAPLPPPLVAILDAAETHDIDALMQHVGASKQTCVTDAERGQLDPRPPCGAGQSTGDIAAGFLTAQCEGGFAPTSDTSAIRAAIEDYFNAPLRLYGVFRTPGIWLGAETYTAIFYGFAEFERFAIVAMLNDSGLVGVGTGCGATPEQLGAPYAPPIR